MSVDTGVLEVESKFEVPVDVELPDLSGLPHGGAVGAPQRIDLEAVYYDTAGLDLMALGITLRRRSGGDDAGWHLKLPCDAGRHELREPLTSEERIPERLVELLRGITRGGPLEHVGTISTRRTVVPLTDTTGHVVAEVCDDRVTGVRWSGVLRTRLVWREWELELVGDAHELAQEAAARLRCAGASPATYPSKLAHVLDVRDPAVHLEPGVAGGTARDVLAPYLAGQVRRLRQLDPQVRADLPDAVHQMRVACRRIRAVLSCFHRDLDDAAARHLRSELGWLVDVLGGERDLEVLRDHVGALVVRHGPDAAAREAWIGASLARDLTAARGAARAALDSDRYDALVLGLTDSARWPPWSDRADRPAGRELRRGLRAEWARLGAAAKAAERVRGRRRDEALHEVRKSAKRLRYGAEAVGSRFGEHAEALAEAMAELQDVLGRHHDETVARAAVARLGREPRAGDRRGGVGRIVQELGDEQAVDAKTYARAWKQLSHRRATRRWLG